MSRINSGLIGLNPYQLGWLAGLLEGDGSFTNDGIGPRIQVRMTDKDTVARVAKFLNSSVLGPYDNNQDDKHERRPVYMCFISGDKARSAMQFLKFHMSARRQNQIDNLLGNQKPLFDFDRELSSVPRGAI